MKYGEDFEVHVRGRSDLVYSEKDRILHGQIEFGGTPVVYRCTINRACPNYANAHFERTARLKVQAIPTESLV